MSLIRLQDVSVRFDNTQILREAFFRLEAGDRVGLIGKNGSGKTTILKLVLDQVAPDAGTVTLEPGTRMGYFSQFSELDGDATILEVLDGLFAEIKAVEAELAAIDAAIAADSRRRRTRPAHPPPGRAVRGHGPARRLGLPAPHRHRPDHPGLRARPTAPARSTNCPAAGATGRPWPRSCSKRPDVLLLDEPTNFLDVAGVEWLEGWFRDFKGAAIIVSHDRKFLDAVVTRIIEVENFHLHEYPGNFGEYVVPEAVPAQDPGEPVRARVRAAGLRSRGHRRPPRGGQGGQPGAGEPAGQDQEVHARPGPSTRSSPRSTAACTSRTSSAGWRDWASPTATGRCSTT